LEKINKLTNGEMIRAMTGEQDAISYYQQLMTITQDSKNREILSDIRNDEITHFKDFMELYHRIYSKSPELPTVKNPIIPSFEEGLQAAIADELNAYEFYRDIYLNNSSPVIRNMFFKAYTDENKHASKLIYILTKFYGNRH
jgi:rubrerythrin